MKHWVPRLENTGQNMSCTQPVYHRDSPDAIGRYRHFSVVARMVIKYLVTGHTNAILNTCYHRTHTHRTQYSIPTFGSMFDMAQ